MVVLPHISEVPHNLYHRRHDDIPNTRSRDSVRLWLHAHNLWTPIQLA